MKKTLIICIITLCVVPTHAQLARWTEGSVGPVLAAREAYDEARAAS